MEINKIVVSNKIPFGKQDFKYFIGYKDDKKLYLYAYSIHKWVYIEQNFVKLNVCIFRLKKCLKNVMKFGKKSAISSK